MHTSMLSAMMANAPRSNEKEYGLQQYLALTTEQDSLRRRLSQSSCGSPTSTSPFYHISSEAGSPLSSSPTNMTQASYPAGAPTTAPYPLPHGGHASAVVAPSAQQHHYEEDRLYEVNQQIKTVLTGLLNCEAVRHGDSGFRAWVQGRLMDNELELKRQRRRRSSVDNREVADFIATHLDHHGFRYTV